MSGFVVDQYDKRRVHGTSAAYRTGLSGADSNAVGVPMTSGALLREAKAPTIAAVARFSVAGASVVVRPVFYASKDAEGDGDSQATYELVGIGDRRTLTAGADQDSASKYIATIETWDTHGATHYELRVEAPSAGTVDLHAWEY